MEVYHDPREGRIPAPLWQSEGSQGSLDLASYEQEMQRGMSSPEFSAWYQKFIPLVESGRREIFTLLD